MTLEDLIRDSHARAVRKGWWDAERSDGADGLAHGLVLRSVPEKLVLIHSEVSEALECYREGEMGTAFDSTGCGDGPKKPVGFPSEIADVVIRVCDLLGALGVVYRDMGTVVRENPGTITAWLARIHLDVSRAMLAHEGVHAALRRAHLFDVVDTCYALARCVGFDLDEAIERKACFNESRPHRHGGKRC